MKGFKEYVNEKEEKDYSDRLDEGVAEVVGTALGLGAAGLILAFGGTLIAYGGATAVSKIVGIWRKIKGKIDVIRGVKKEDVADAIKDIKQDAKVKIEKEKLERNRREFEDELSEVYSAIDKNDPRLAKEAFGRLQKSFADNPDVHRTIIAEVTKKLSEPPLYINSPGNKTYQFIKKVISIRTARAAADATKMALDKKLEKSSEPEEDEEEV